MGHAWTRWGGRDPEEEGRDAVFSYDMGAPAIASSDPEEEGAPTSSLASRVQASRERAERIERARRSVDVNGALYMHGLFHVTEVCTGTGRLYPFSVLGPAVDAYFLDSVVSRTAWGEFEHPPLASASEFRATGLRGRTSHEVVALRWVMPGRDPVAGEQELGGAPGPWLHGIVRVLSDTEAGRHVFRMVVTLGMRMGIASRGWATCSPTPPAGSISEETRSGTVSVIQPDFEQLAFDIVEESAVPGAYLEPLDCEWAGHPPWPSFRDLLRAEVGGRIRPRKGLRVPCVKA